jgi:hypothetical protein
MDSNSEYCSYSTQVGTHPPLIMPYTDLLHHDFDPGKSSIWRMRHDTHYEASLHVAAKLKMHGDDRAKAKARSEGRKKHYSMR